MKYDLTKRWIRKADTWVAEMRHMRGGEHGGFVKNWWKKCCIIQHLLAYEFHSTSVTCLMHIFSSSLCRCTAETALCLQKLVSAKLWQAYISKMFDISSGTKKNNWTSMSYCVFDGFWKGSKSPRVILYCLYCYLLVCSCLCLFV